MDGSLAKTTGVRTVTAAVAVAPLRTELRRLPVPAVGPDDGLLAVDACGLCGTDWDFYTRQRGAHLGPLILGHEIVGRVAALGEDAAKRWNITSGDRIAVEEFLPCGQCEFCRSGRPALCEATDSRSEGPFLRYGATSIDIPPGLWGGFSEILYLHPHALVHRIPDDLSSDLATLFVPVSNGVRWVLKEGRLPRGGTAVIIGPGAHGLGCVVAAVEGGARHVIAVSRSSAARLEAARALGAIPIAADRTDVVAKVREITNGEMADLIVDLAPGAPETVETALALARKGAVIILAASKHGKPVTESFNDIVIRKELTVKGVRGRDYQSVEEALRIIASRRYPLERIRTHEFPLGQADQALRVLGERADPSAIHITVVP
ncbi:MAG: zinc-binding dehydrogenase [Bacillati bacterium ANGP1]|uniref:Zinc-binding dehydrogenase n=1 Tax=Candidatus Segetimicrobium genomatis TaxID=2569760 RepID=A0A537IJM3_9BACT|nr:MAG: zinc-binding dehydrogenase [Terrabacteria group bacterium ANGP1]